MRKFKIGERVIVVAPHTWNGRTYRECEVGDTGTIRDNGEAPHVYGVTWNKQDGKVPWSLIDGTCLGPEDPGPTEEEIAELFYGAPKSEPCSHCHGTGVKP